jgi:hypothetical protein
MHHAQRIHSLAPCNSCNSYTGTFCWLPMCNKTLIILTLKKHEDGIWIHQLVEALRKTAQNHGIFVADAAPIKNQQDAPRVSDKATSVSIKVQSLEEWLAQGWLVSSDCFEGVMGIVNRVSDAASPPLFKACCAILGVAQVMNIPIVNGPTAYALCGNKWCHHILFHQAGLASPTTFAFWNDPDSSNQNAPGMQHDTTPKGIDDGTPLLIKPNAGGFGAGIRRVTAPLQDDLPVFEDSMALLQIYHPPKDKKLYRIWFLRGKVQCGVERSVQDEESEFTNACSGSCSLQKPPKAWCVPLEVRLEIENQLLPLLIDAHCGSVEFLYYSGNDRLYFDLNMLSTLPIKVSDADAVWEKGYDPWIELATGVWAVITSRKIDHVTN